MKLIKKAIFPVAGLGTRFLPATKAMPKEMLPVIDKPLIQYAVEEAKHAGIEEIIFVTGRAKSAIEDHFDRSIELEAELGARKKTQALEEVQNILWSPGHISYTRQQEPLGLGHAVWCARNFIGEEPFAVILADDLIHPHKKQGYCLEQMINVYESVGHNSNIVAVEKIPPEDTSKYGVLDPKNETGRIIKANNIVEKPSTREAPSRYGVIGRYILQPSIMKILENQSRGTGNEIQLTDALSTAIPTNNLLGLLFSGKRFDCGNKAGWLEANIFLALETVDLKDKVKQIIKNASEL